jgi:hypothetical protein
LISQDIRLGIIAQLAKTDPWLDTQTVCDFMFYLEAISGHSFGYDFSMSPSGIYSSQLMSDIYRAEYEKVISLTSVKIDDWYGRKINYAENSDEYTKKIFYLEKNKDEPDFNIAHEIAFIKAEFGDVIFGGYNRENIELSTAIIFAYKTFINEQWDYNAENIIRYAAQLQPHLDIEKLKKTYDNLRGEGILKKIANANGYTGMERYNRANYIEKLLELKNEGDRFSFQTEKEEHYETKLVVVGDAPVYVTAFFGGGGKCFAFTGTNEDYLSFLVDEMFTVLELGEYIYVE